MILRARLWCILIATLAALPCSHAKKKSPPPEPSVREIVGTVERTVPLRTHSLYAPYVDSDLQNRWWDFGGSAIVNTAKHIRLTQDRPSQVGWLWSRLPMSPSAFEIEFEFRIDGKSNNIYGDGFALWLTRARAQPGPVFGNQDHWDGLGVFFDTYANSRHSYSFPQIIAFMNDGSKSYDLGKDGAGQEDGRCSIDYRRTEISTKAKLIYFKNNFLQLKVQHAKWDEWETCFTLLNVTLPGSPFLGFTAHTGDVSDEHDIVAISTSNAVYHEPTAAERLSRARGDSNRTAVGFGFFAALFRLLKWLVFIVLVVVAVMAVRSWKVRRDSKRF